MKSTLVSKGSFALALAVAIGACSDAPPPTPVMTMDAAEETAAHDEADSKAERRPAHVRSTPMAGGNQPPVVRSLIVAEAEEDPSLWEALIDVHDPDGDDVELAIVWKVNGKSAAKDVRTFDPTIHKRGDSIHVEVTPHDGKVAGATAGSGVMTLANAPPAITSRPTARMDGGVFRYMVEAKDPDGDKPLRFELEQAPDGMQIDPFNGELSWRPGKDQLGEHKVVIVVSDNRNAKATQEFVLPISGPASSVPAAPAP